MTEVVIVESPHILVVAGMTLDYEGLQGMIRILAEQGGAGLELGDDSDPMGVLFRHNGQRLDPSQATMLTDNELLAELAGRKCYNSFGSKIGHGDNEGYLANILGAPGKIQHASVLYHAKMTFFFSGISRRMSHELIRHYVGADRTEEGCPSQESTRYTEHPGHFIAHPRHLRSHASRSNFTEDMQEFYTRYLSYLHREVAQFRADNGGEPPKGMDRKRIYEAAAALLPGAASTSMFWTTNPVALQKIFLERCDVASDLEFQRFACALRDLCYKKWPNLFRSSNPACEQVHV